MKNFNNRLNVKYAKIMNSKIMYLKKCSDHRTRSKHARDLRVWSHRLKDMYEVYNGNRFSSFLRWIYNSNCLQLVKFDKYRYRAKKCHKSILIGFESLRI